MPLTLRQLAQRELERAGNNLNWVGTHLVWISANYEKDHPEIAAKSDALCTLTANLQTLILELKRSF